MTVEPPAAAKPATEARQAVSHAEGLSVLGEQWTAIKPARSMPMANEPVAKAAVPKAPVAALAAVAAGSAASAVAMPSSWAASGDAPKLVVEQPKQGREQLADALRRLQQLNNGEDKAASATAQAPLLAAGVAHTPLAASAAQEQQQQRTSAAGNNG